MSEPRADSRDNSRANNREGLLLPVILPVGILGGIGVILFGFSRILLYVTKHAATGIALATAVTIMVVCSFVANRKKLSGAALFPMVGGIAGIVLLLGGVAMLAAQKHEGGGPAAITVALVAPPTASAKGFDTKTLSFKAGTPTNLTFDNEEPSVQHNVVIFQGTSDTGPQVFTGALVTGPAKTTYRVPALAAGSSHYFHCEVHPTTMFGTITVSAAAVGGGGLDITAANVQFGRPTSSRRRRRTPRRNCCSRTRTPARRTTSRSTRTAPTPRCSFRATRSPAPPAPRTTCPRSPRAPTTSTARCTPRR